MPIAICFVDFDSNDKGVVDESKRMVNLVLPELAKAVYKATVVTYASIKEYGMARS